MPLQLPFLFTWLLWHKMCLKHYQFCLLVLVWCRFWLIVNYVLWLLKHTTWTVKCLVQTICLKREIFQCHVKSMLVGYVLCLCGFLSWSDLNWVQLVPFHLINHVIHLLQVSRTCSINVLVSVILITSFITVEIFHLVVIFSNQS